MSAEPPQPAYRATGWCPVCEADAVYEARYPWYRDHLRCTGCEPRGGSVPRDRAVAWVLYSAFPEWRRLAVHECSPGGNALSRKLYDQCPRYVGSNWYPDLPPGVQVGHLRNENLEALTLPDDGVDLFVSLDVLEHLDRPDRASAEIARVLRPGGAHVFTAPTYAELVASQRRARVLPDGGVEHIAEPEYHGNPISDEGVLVFHRYGYDLPDLLRRWSGVDVAVTRFSHAGLGILGGFTEVYVCTKPGPPLRAVRDLLGAGG